MRIFKKKQLLFFISKTHITLIKNNILLLKPPNGLWRHIVRHMLTTLCSNKMINFNLYILSAITSRHRHILHLCNGGNLKSWRYRGRRRKVNTFTAGPKRSSLACIENFFSDVLNLSHENNLSMHKRRYFAGLLIKKKRRKFNAISTWLQILYYLQDTPIGIFTFWLK